MNDHPSSARRALLAAPLAALLPSGALAQAPSGVKELRLAFRSAESSFDPAAISDLYSRCITSHIFEAAYGYDHLARPVKIKPVLAEGMPEVSADFRTWTVRIRKGVFFADDPAFKGRRREVEARDIAYAFLRTVDPANKSSGASEIFEAGILGLEDLQKKALAERKPFDYDAKIPGIELLDRHTIRFRLAEARPRFVETLLAAPDIYPAQAREVVEHYGSQIGDHPVGTGPFKLKSWTRASKIVLERNPQFREMVWEAEPAADDAEGQQIAAQMRGKRIPIVDRVVISIVEEAQPRWLSFLNAESDAIAGQVSPLPSEFVPQAVPNGQLAPNLAKRGIRLQSVVQSDMMFIYFNMDDPVVGGMDPQRTALRRAISLGYDVPRYITIGMRGAGVPAHGPVVPGVSGYDPNFRSEMGEFDPNRARALLDMFGYVDRNGDGLRELPDGKPLVLTMTTSPDQIYRTYDDILRRSMLDIGIKVVFRTQQWSTSLKQALAGQLQMWSLGSSASMPDGQGALARLSGPSAGEQNLARFRSAEFDKLYDRMKALPDGPEREKLFFEAKRIAVAYMPMKVIAHRIGHELLYPWISGYRRTVFWQEWWHMVDVDVAMRARM